MRKCRFAVLQRRKNGEPEGPPVLHAAEVAGGWQDVTERFTPQEIAEASERYRQARAVRDAARRGL